MFHRRFLKEVTAYLKFNYGQTHIKRQCVRCLQTSTLKLKNENESNTKSKEIIPRHSFEDIKDKTKNSYLEMVQIFISRHVDRRNHVEFIYAALKNMEAFGVQKDLEVYKALIDVFPKGKLIPQNMLQAEFMHYPKQQHCALDLLEQMEDNGVMPDTEMEDMLLNIFGKRGYPLRKYWRMMYWMPRFKNLTPWPLPEPITDDVLELAKLAISRISSVDIKSVITVYETADIKESIDKTWIVSAQSPIQKKLLENHDVTQPIYAEGPFRVWLKHKSVNYFILRANASQEKDDEIENLDEVSSIKVSPYNLRPPVKQPAKVPSVHEQNDGTIFSVCATGSSSKDSLLSWVRHLESDGNPALGNVSVVFTLKSGFGELSVVDQDDSTVKKV